LQNKNKNKKKCFPSLGKSHPRKFGVGIEVGVVIGVAEGPHPQAAMTVLPSTNAERPGMTSELQTKNRK